MLIFNNPTRTLTALRLTLARPWRRSGRPGGCLQRTPRTRPRLPRIFWSCRSAPLPPPRLPPPTSLLDFHRPTCGPGGSCPVAAREDEIERKIGWFNETIKHMQILGDKIRAAAIKLDLMKDPIVDLSMKAVNRIKSFAGYDRKD